MADDPLEALLGLIRAEAFSGPDQWRALTAALRERAQVVIADRDRSLGALERENAWKAETIANLVAENRWREDAMKTLAATLEARDAKVDWLEATLKAVADERDYERGSVRKLKDEAEALRAQLDAAAASHVQLSAAFSDLGREADALRTEWRSASAAHERLLAHHRGVVLDLAKAMELLPPALPWRYREVGRRLAELAAALREEIA